MFNGRSAVKLLLIQRATWTFELCCLESPINKWCSLRTRNWRVRGALGSKIEKGHPSKTIACVAGVIGEGEEERGRREKNPPHFFSLPFPFLFPDYAGHAGYQDNGCLPKGWDWGVPFLVFKVFSLGFATLFFQKRYLFAKNMGCLWMLPFWSPVDKWFSWIQLKLTCQAGNYLSPTSSNFQILSSHFQELYLLSYVIYKWFFSF